MGSNYLLVGLRALAKNRTYAFINIFGLALGLAACLLILLYVRYETSYENWWPESERVHQVQATWRENGQPVTRNQRSPLPVRDTIAAGFPQIEAVSIAEPVRVAAVRETQPLYVDALFVDPAFLDILPLQFVHGSAASALNDVGAVVLSESEAMRQFGAVNAVGRTFTRSRKGERHDYEVTGVFRDLPENTHLKFEALFRFDPAVYNDVPAEFKGWGNMNQLHYVKLRPGADAQAINAALPAWEKRVVPAQVIDGRTASQADVMDLRLVPVRDVHLGEAQLLSLKPGNDRRTVATFAIVALLILVMATVNFVNLSTARAGQRAREVALRKVLGASRTNLIVQFLGESLLLTGLAMLFALTIVELSAPLLGSLLGIDLSVGYFGAGGFLLPALGLVLLVGIAGGLYPAFYLSRFQPATILKANKSAADAHGSGRLRNLLVVAQFAISIGLIVCTAVVYSQTRFVQTVDPGFVREGLIQVEDGWRLAEGGNYDSAKRAMAALPGVVGVAGTNLGLAARNKQIISVQGAGAEPGANMGFYRTDADFFKVMEMRLLAGRPLGETYANDRMPEPAEGDEGNPGLVGRGLNIVVNRMAARQFGFREPAAAVGQQVRVGIDGGEMVPSTIVGVFEDTRIRTARDEVEPLLFGYGPAGATEIIVRYRAEQPAQVMAAIQTVWKRFLPDIPFEAAFAEDLVAELYQAERARGSVFAGFAVLAIVISCLGLFGLAAFTSERRTREIGIRKVLGATVRDIVQLLTWQFSKPVILANLVAWPAAWWVMRDWLNTFDARIALTPGPFVLAGLIAFAIAVGTIAGHAIKVARMNPVHALRYE